MPLARAPCGLFPAHLLLALFLPRPRAQITGHIEHTDFLAKYQSVEGVLYARPLVTPGHNCVCVKDGLPTWVCELMVVRPRVKDAIDWIKVMEEEINEQLYKIIK